jgi:hypothetical protein
VNTVTDIARFASITRHVTFPAQWPQKPRRHRCSFIIGIASLLVSSFISPAIPAEQDPEAERVANAGSERLVQLGLKPRTTESVPEKALHVRNAIKASDFPTAHQVSTEIFGASRLQTGATIPFRTLSSACQMWTILRLRKN